MSSAEKARWFCEHVPPHEPALRAYLQQPGLDRWSKVAGQPYPELQQTLKAASADLYDIATRKS